jgi:hypothetical protein
MDGVSERERERKKMMSQHTWQIILLFGSDGGFSHPPMSAHQHLIIARVIVMAAFYTTSRPRTEPIIALLWAVIT